MSIVDKVKHSVHTVFKGAAESVMTTRTTSAFVEKGVVTPEEFVVAGDFLVQQCPTWAWQAGDPKRAKPFLPEDKQFLVTRNVPCRERAAAMEQFAGKEVHLSGDDEGWVEAGGDGAGDADDADDIPDIDAGVAAATLASPSEEADGASDASSDVPDMEDFVDVAAEEEEDEASLFSAKKAAASAEAPVPVPGLPPVAGSAAIVDLTGDDEAPGPVDERPEPPRNRKPQRWVAKKKKK